MKFREIMHKAKYYFGTYEWDELMSLSTPEVCERIANRTEKIVSFWKNAGGWAPAEPAELLRKSMLDWQLSLSQCLAKWIDANSDGELILAYANLGSLVEGTMKLFLSVYLNDYNREPVKVGKVFQGPDELMLERLRQFFDQKIWNDVGINWSPWIQHIQQRRNCIHAYKKRSLGTFDEWQEDVRTYLMFLIDMDGSLPYP